MDAFLIQPSFSKIWLTAYFNLESGKTIAGFLTADAFLILVNMSPMGSVIFLINVLFDYQLDFLMPGKSPLSANSRKQMRQSLKARR